MAAEAAVAAVAGVATGMGVAAAAVWAAVAAVGVAAAAAAVTCRWRRFTHFTAWPRHQRYSGGRVHTGFAFPPPAAVFDKAYSGRGRHHGARPMPGSHDNWNGHHHGRHYRRFYGPYIYGGGYGYYDDYGYDDCYWLRRQAIITGSPVWWRRYYACAG